VRAFQVRWPPVVTECRVATGDAAEEGLTSVGPENEIRVPLPESQRRAVIHIRYSSSGSGFGAWPTGKLTAPIPQPDLPVLTKSWSVLLPPKLAAMVDRQFPAAADENATTGPSSVHTLRTSLDGPQLASRLALFSAPPAQASSDPAFRGWTVIDLDLPPGNEATLAVYRPTIVGTWSLCLGLIAAGMVMRLRDVPRWIGPVALLLIALAVAL